MTVSVLVLVAASIAELPTKLVYNGSTSARIGFYWIDNAPVGRGDLVLMEVPERVRNLVETRRYLLLGVPLIKRIVAVGGDKICRRKREILLDVVTVAVARNEDRLGRPMPSWHGCRVLREDQIFVLQAHPDSLDGRYFGPVDRSLVIGRATRLRVPWQK
ncbi:S26 family signal peptidase [Chelativorans sp. M5D2P16]|uniref:S26 family signal peptidase n=1 Tax=Chelativorans sp. M5D2P16 TaxID=3095678 RepID=UPI002ACA6F18|nr:S26 family signal peptidase [Chelativorans sp. M5D2P16]MDZ5696732.1 S26 family signal peptidase [Chelativorans sp. M5D2P16]